MSFRVDGLCGCGCGMPAPLAPQTSRRFGWTKGRPLKFVLGHNGYLAKRGYVIDPVSGCWNYLGWIRANGYAGTVKYSGRFITAYRRSFLESGKEIPEGTELDHVCRNPSCVNPIHLEAVSRAVNERRKPTTKLTEEAVIQICAEVAGGAKQRDLAKRFSVSPSLIYLVVKRKAWK